VLLTLLLRIIHRDSSLYTLIPTQGDKDKLCSLFLWYSDCT